MTARQQNQQPSLPGFHTCRGAAAAAVHLCVVATAACLCSRISPRRHHRQGLPRSDSGCVIVDTGKFTGRSPKDKWVVEEAATKDVWWGPINQKMSPEIFSELEAKCTVCTALCTERAHTQHACKESKPTRRSKRTV